MSYFVETLARNGEWARCRKTYLVEAEDISTDIHSGRPTEFFELEDAKEFVEWIWRSRFEGIRGVRVIEPTFGVIGPKAVMSIGASV